MSNNLADRTTSALMDRCVTLHIQEQRQIWAQMMVNAFGVYHGLNGGSIDSLVASKEMIERIAKMVSKTPGAAP